MGTKASSFSNPFGSLVSLDSLASGFSCLGSFAGVIARARFLEPCLAFLGVRDEDDRFSDFLFADLVCFFVFSSTGLPCLAAEKDLPEKWTCLAPGVFPTFSSVLWGLVLLFLVFP